MLRIALSLLTAAILAGSSTAAALAHGHGEGHYRHAYAGSALVVDGDNASDDDDVVSVAEPAVQYVPATTTYVTTNDAVVTPYGYAPVYNNGYYQGYNYNPQYAYNPYYAAAVYSNTDPLATAVVSTVANVLSNGGHVSSSSLVSSLLNGFLAAQAQQQYQQQYNQQPYYYPQQPSYYPQPYYSSQDNTQAVVAGALLQLLTQH